MRLQIFPLVAVLSVSIGCDALSSTSQDPKLSAAWNYIKNSVNTPSTAKLIDYNSWKLPKYDANIYKLVFDSQNNFGAIIRQDAWVMLYVNKKTNEIIVMKDIHVENSNNPDKEMSNHDQTVMKALIRVNTFYDDLKNDAVEKD